MSGRVATWLSIAVGGTGGALVALIGSSAPAPLPTGSLPLRPIGQLATPEAAPSASAGGQALASPLTAPATDAG